MDRDYYSLRMHASKGGAHLSGAERLLTAAELDAAAQELLRRAREHPGGEADAVRLSVDRVAAESIRFAPLPELRTLQVADVAEGRAAAAGLLQRCGVSPAAIRTAVVAMAAGAAGQGRNMRGAMLIDAASGARLEADPQRGVRASRMDLAPRAADQLRQVLGALGLAHRNVREALVLAGKVALAPGVTAELCWSDDPDYVTGYVCSREHGYLRLTQLKAAGDPHGGRAFFVAPGTCIAALADWLQASPILFDRVAPCHPAVSWREYAAQLAAGT